jgi:hypothetical protein
VPARLKPYLLPAWSVLLALIVLLPVLAPGYVLHVDMVFVPHQTLLPWNFGIGAGLPRAVPQDAIVSFIAGPIPGEIVQKAVLFGALVLAGVGAGRLAGDGLRVQLAAASVYLWSAYTASRLLMGHWGLLWAVGLLPWVILAARRARERGQWLDLALLCGVAALVPSGGLLTAAVAIPLGIGFRSVLTWVQRGLFVGSVLLVNAPWWLAGLRSTSATVSDPLGLVVFGARADGVGGVLASVLAGGGVWNIQATLGSRSTWFPFMGLLVLLLLAGAGWSQWARRARPEAIVLGLLGMAGVGWAWISGVADDQGWAQQIVSALPGGGLLRDGQKWTAWWVLLLAVCAPWGLQRLLARAEDSLRLVLAGALAVLPLAMMPDLAAGGFGRLNPTEYPRTWDTLRERLAQAPETGDVLSLPWAPFRRYEWNRSQVVLDPLPRYLTRTVVWNDRLPVTWKGRVIEVGGDDPRAAAISRVIASGQPLPPTLAKLGIGWIVVQRDQPAVTRPVDLRGAEVMSRDGELELWRVDVPVQPHDASDPLLITVNIVVAFFVVGGAMIVGSRRWRHARV